MTKKQMKNSSIPNRRHPI